MNAERPELLDGQEAPWPHAERPPEPAPPMAESPVFRLRFQEYFEFAPDCQIVTDMRGIILEANQASTLILDCRKEFLIDKPLGLFVMPGWRTRFYRCLRLLETASADEFEARIGQRGEPRDVLMRVSLCQVAHSGTFCHWLIRDVTERHRIEASRVNLLKRITTVQEEERRRIARELHDEMGQHLTALILDLKLLGDAFDAADPVRTRLDDLRRSAGQIGQLVHRLASELRPAAIDDLGLDVALRNYVTSWSRRTGVRADIYVVGEIGEPIADEAEIAIYRITQEALTNVAKHAGATRASIILERRESSLRLIIEDNGRGFDADLVWESVARETRFGLIGIKERVAMSGGSLIIESAPGGPTSIYAEILTTHSQSEADRG